MLGYGNSMYIYNHGIYASSGVQPLILDTYTNSVAAWSLKKLRTAYTGNCIRVRRSSDNTEQNIGFSGTSLDTTSLLSFCSGTNGFVTTWYDQSGNGYNMTQTSATLQPQIVSAGSLIVSGSRPAMQFDGSNDYMINYLSGLGDVTFAGEDKPVSIVQVVDVSTAKYNEMISIGKQGSGTGLEIFSPFRMDSATQYATIKRDNGGTLKSSSFGTATTGIQLLTSYSGGTTATCRKNASDIASGVDVNVGAISTDNVALGALVRNTIGGYAHMKAMEFIMFASNESANIAGIETKTNQTYSIY